MCGDISGDRVKTSPQIQSKSSFYSIYFVSKGLSHFTQLKCNLCIDVCNFSFLFLSNKSWFCKSRVTKDLAPSINTMRYAMFKFLSVFYNTKRDT